MIVLDVHMTVMEGSINAIRRWVMVADENYDRACRVLKDAGEGDRLA